MVKDTYMLALFLEKFISRSVPEIIDTVFAKTSPNSSTEYERFGLVFTKTRVYKFRHWKVEKEDKKIYRYI